MAKSDGELMTKTELGRILGVSPAVTREMVDDGLVPGLVSTGDGGRALFSRRMVTAWVACGMPRRSDFERAWSELQAARHIASDGDGGSDGES